ncbi:TPM domain-containing protein [Flavonifractor plautii]|nr:TPM domain-containing protein [Flavonifractor plautii]
MRRPCWARLSLTGGAQAVAEPTAARYVADEADVLSSETEQYIIDKNQSLFEDTGGEIVVVSVDFMDGMDAADYAMAVAESWGGIGDESLNNGFLLVYAVGENKVWAMAGSGIEDALPASKNRGLAGGGLLRRLRRRRIRQRHPRFFRRRVWLV